MEKNKIIGSALLNALGVYVYVLLVATLMRKAKEIFGADGQFLGTVAFLMLFVLSAGVVGSLVLGRPVALYLDGKKKEGVAVLVYTIITLLILTLLTLAILATL